MTDAIGVSPGAFAAILGMTVATYLCRVLGVWLMAHVPLTKPVRDGLAALPGSIVVAVVLPLGVRGGAAAGVGGREPAELADCALVDVG